MKITVEDFIRTGEFGSVKVGMKKQDIIRHLGEPDCDSACGKRGWILQYSSYELFVNRNDKLFAIQNDSFDPQIPDSYKISGELIDFDSWFFNASENMDLNEIADLLKSREINYSLVDYFGRTVIKAESGVIIDFSDEENEEGIRELIGIRYWPE